MQRAIGYVFGLAAVVAFGCGGAQESSSSPATAVATAPVSGANSATTSAVKAQPDGYFTLTPSLVVDNVDEAVDFYVANLGATRGMVLKSPDGSMTVHAEIRIGDSPIMLEPAAMGGKTPKSLGGAPGSLTVYVENADAVVEKAHAAGAKVSMEVGDQFWGDRYGQIVDPWGHRWGIATHKEVIGDEEIARRFAAVIKAGPAAGELKFKPGKPANSWRPDDYHMVTPTIVVKDAAGSIELYKKIFGAVERTRIPLPDGRIMHAELKIGDSVLMLSDEIPEYEAHSPATLGGTSLGLMVYVADVDSAFAGAVAAGAKVKQPVADMFWGDRFGMVVDPSGHEWGLATHKEDLTPEQMAERMKKQFAAGN